MKKTYAIRMGANDENLMVPGIIVNNDIETKKSQILALWCLKNNKSKKFISQLLSGKQGTLYGVQNQISEKETVVTGGKELSLIHSEQSETFAAKQVVYGNVYTLSNIILIGNQIQNEEEERAEINNKLSEMIVGKYPIPLEDSWKAFFIESIFDSSVKELDIYGNLPYKKAFLVNINTADLEGALAQAFGRQTFIDKFNRAPNMKALWTMIDPGKRFKVKHWQSFLNELGGQENFSTIEDLHQQELVYLYETFGHKAIEIKKLTEEAEIDLFGIPFKSSAISIAKGDLTFNEDLAIKAYKLIIKTLKTQIEKSLAVCSLMSNLGELDLTTLLNKPTELINELRKTSYKPEPGAEGMALVAAELWIKEDIFKDYQGEYLKAMPNIIKSSRTYPTVKGGIGNGYSWESMDMGNPRAWVVGLETNCCQHLHSCGKSCVIFAAENPKSSGMFRVMKKNQTVAQSWFWFNQDTGDFVFDNIEILGGELRDSILECYLDFIEFGLKPRAKLFGIKNVSAGLGCNDMPALKKFPAIKNPTKISSMPGYTKCYTDSNSQVLLSSFENDKKDIS